MFNSNSHNPPPTVSSQPLQAPMSSQPPAPKSHTQVPLETQGNPQGKVEEYPQKSDLFGEFEKLLQDFKSNDQEKQQVGITGIEKTITKMNSIQQSIIDMIPKIIKFVQKTDAPDLQKKALSLLAKICEGNIQQTSQVIANEAIPILLKLLKSPDLGVQQNAINVIGIMADFPKFRDTLSQNDIFTSLILVLEKTQWINIVEKGVWALSKFCQEKPLKDPKVVDMALLTLCGLVERLWKIVQQSKKTKTLVKTLEIIIFLSEGDKKNLETVFMSGVACFLVRYLEISDLPVVTLVLRILEDISAVSWLRIEWFVSACDIVKSLFNLRKHQEENVRRQIWTILSQIIKPNIWLEFLLKNSEYIEQMLEAASSEILEIQVKITKILLNVIECANNDLMMFMADKRVLSFMCRLGKQKEKELCKMGRIGMWYYIKSLFFGLFRIFK